MTWFLVAIMATVYANGDVDVYVFSEPTFTTVEECLEFAANNPYRIASELMTKLNGAPLQKLLCASQEQLKQAFSAETSQNT